ncbi:LPS assembly lipoprotein LptE, partial [Ralstonia pickettii]|uniref:LPS-assembly lipoprotein LptE n=1 Tax=Ralstonia pickettii TaxID=329 RepID=UPI000AD8CC6B
TISSLTPQGVVREYRITYRFRFQLRDAHDNLLIPPSEITQFRDLSYNETQVLAKDYEEAALYRDMQGDTINQLVRRLGSIGGGADEVMLGIICKYMNTLPGKKG